MKKERKLCLSTAEGCKKLLLISFCIILLFSALARLATTSGGNIKMEGLTIDARGGTLDCEMYYPAGTSSEDSLPAVVVTHGGSSHAAAYRQFAQEIARRGFVALLVNAYGNGVSEEPRFEETQQGESSFNSMATPLGMWDAVEYVRNLTFVDATRIGVAGHSMGALRSTAAAQKDCYYYNYNDLLINILYDTFGQSFTAEEITQDAVALAEARLNADQLAHFKHLAEETKAVYDTRIKALSPMGMTMCTVLAPQVLTVAGHEVTRSCKVNIGFVNGTFESRSPTFLADAGTVTGFMTGETPVELSTYYAVDDASLTSTIVGAAGESGGELAAAAENRSLRTVYWSDDTHSKLYLSKAAVANFIDYFQIALGVESDMPTTSQVWPLRTACNAIAMFAMLFMILPLVCLLTKTKFFAPVVAVAAPAEKRIKIGKLGFIILAVATAGVSMWAVRLGAKNYSKFFDINFLNNTKVWAVQSGANGTRIFITVMTLFSVLLLVIYALISKKKTGSSGLDALNLKIGVVNVLKSILIGIVFIFVAYTALLTIEYWFEEDFRLWQMAFTEIRPERWLTAVPYFIYFYICYVIIGAAVNYTKNSDMPEWKDTLIIVIINSLGVWIACAITFFVIRGEGWTGNIPFDFMLFYSLNLFVPLTIYITRKMYNLTNQIWVGAAINTVLACWNLVSANSQVYYKAQDWLSNFLA